MTRILSRRMAQCPSEHIGERRQPRATGSAAYLRGGRLGALGGTQLGGAGARVACNLIVIGSHRSLGEHAECRRRAFDLAAHDASRRGSRRDRRETS